MEHEYWVPVPGYEGYYEISNLSRIHSINRSIQTKAGYFKPEKERLLVQRTNNKGYLTVTLSKDGYSKTHFVHRLLATVYIPNPANKPILNHLDGDKLNNRLDNLEWVTYSENALHAYKTGLYASNERKGRMIVDTCTGRVFKSLKKAAEYLSLNYSTVRNYLSGSTPNTTCLQYAI